jgi:hypothetical protein
MPAVLISFNASERLRSEWYGTALDERLKNVLRILALYMNGIRITCLCRSQRENDSLPDSAKNSKHLPDPETGKCRAADFNPPQSERSPETWRRKVKDYCDRQFAGVYCLIKDHGTATHVHLDIRPDKGFEVEML